MDISGTITVSCAHVNGLRVSSIELIVSLIPERRRTLKEELIKIFIFKYLHPR
jgi:hypothetical protein